MRSSKFSRTPFASIVAFASIAARGRRSGTRPQGASGHARGAKSLDGVGCAHICAQTRTHLHTITHMAQCGNTQLLQEAHNCCKKNLLP
eukprot:13683625-Alexandrium_andersonii.AAC.1